MALDLVDHRFDLAACQYVVKDWYGAIANSDAFGEAFLDKSFHSCPNDMVGWGCNLPVATVKVDQRSHPMNQVQVDIVKLQLLKTCLDCALDIVLISVPKFCRDE